MQSPTIMNVDQSDAKASADDRVDTVQKAIREIIKDRARIEYHHPAINFLDEPPQREFARYVVK